MTRKMKPTFLQGSFWLNMATAAGLLVSGSLAMAQNPAGQEAPYWQTQAQQTETSIYRVAQRRSPQQTARTNGTQHAQVAQQQQHPLDPIIAAYQNSLQVMNGVRDYEYTFVKRERLNGTLGPYNQLAMKLRHQPLSIYVNYLAPDDVKGREAIYVHGKNNNQLQAHATGFQKMILGTLSLDPTGSMAMQSNRYPITRAGIMNSVQNGLRRWQKERQLSFQPDVRIVPGAKVDGRACTLVQVTYPEKKTGVTFHRVRVYLDDEWRVPVRTEEYDFPSTPGGQPVLMGEYTYTKVRFNVGLKDVDFSTDNPKYDFP
ncbi:Hypothetical protein PBC10988_29570 [Planctomycetales bacterium 10988]|nr:Hypothetical protein PBC10988_29570 [Planctomycetales bacterium 10988]